MENSVKTLLENNLRNAYTYNDQNPEDFGFSVLIQFIKNYLIYHEQEFYALEQFTVRNTFFKQFKIVDLVENNIFKGINFEIISLDDFCVSCDYLITYIISQRAYILSYTPEPLNDLIVSLLQPQPNQIIYDPVCGIGSTFVTLHKKFPNSYFTFVGQELNRKIQFLCNLNLLLNAISNNNIFLGDSLLNPPLQYKGKVDIAIAVLPLSTKLNKESLSKNIFENPQDIPNADYAFVELILAMLNENGKAVIIVPDSFLSLSNGKNYRKKYIEQGIIELIYSLPKDAFIHSSIKVSIIVFNKNKLNYTKEIITFAKLTNKGQTISESLKINEITNFNLSANRYTHKNSDEFKKILENTPKNQIFTINQVAEIVRGKPYSKEKVYSQAINALPYVGIKNLAANGILDIEKVTRKVMPDNYTKTINFSAILVSLLGTNLKLNYFEYQEQAIITSSDIVALRLKKDFDKDFILLQLQSRLVQIQAEMFVTGDIVERIAIEDFKNIQLIIPSPQEQQRQIIEMRGLFIEKNKAITEIAEAKEEIKITEYDVIATIAHNLNQKLGAIRDDYDGLISFLYRMEKEKKLLNFTAPLRPLRMGEEFSKVDALEDVTKRISEILLDASQTLKTTEDILQKDKVDLQEVDFVEFLETEKKKYSNEKFAIEIQTRLKSLTISIDSSAIKDTLRNLIINAERHGFVKNDIKYIFVFELTKISIEDGEYLRLVCKNNGKPFPKGFTFAEYTRLGGRSGKNKGTGIGGFFIKKVIDLHNGKFNYIPIKNSLEIYQVQFEILLPLLS